MKTVELSLALVPQMLPTAVSFAEQSGKAFGLGQIRQQKLAQAVEKLFSFLVAHDTQGSMVRLLCWDGGFYVKLDCIFPINVLPAAAFNITAKEQYEDEDCLEKLGMLLAVRAVDRIDVVRKHHNLLEVSLVVEKEFAIGACSLTPLLASERYTVKNVGMEEIKQFAQRVTADYGVDAPAFFKFPGKVVNMVSSSEYNAALAIDGKGNVGAGVLWRQMGKMVEFYGPYLFAKQAGLAQAVTDAALAKLASTKAVCMVSMQPTADIPQGYFEILGDIMFQKPDSRQVQQRVLYRQLDEDNGAVVYANPALHPFLQDCYNRLILPRTIIPADNAGENLPKRSAFSVALDWHQHQAVLSKLAVGQDAKNNLSEHVAFLRSEGVPNIFFQLDAGKNEEAILAPALLASGFVPRLVLPWGGKGDVVLFQYGVEN